MSLTLRNELSQLSRELLLLHKALMELQKNKEAQKMGRSPTPQELLGFLYSHPDFQWLRVITDRVLKIDEAVDSKDVDLFNFKSKIAPDLRAVFFIPGAHSEFQEKLNLALNEEPSLLSRVALIREKLE